MDKLYKYPCMDGNIYICRPGSCLICKTVSSVIWDYTHGPYHIICGLELEPQEDLIENRLKCKYFKLDDMYDEV